MPMITARPIPAPYRPRPAGRPSAAAKPGEKIHRKPGFNLAGYDWRAEVLVAPRSLPISTSKGVAMVGRDEIRPRSVNDTTTEAAGEEVGLEDLIEGGKGKREKRVTTATSLGFDFIANPSITALPDEKTETKQVKDVPSGGKAIPRGLRTDEVGLAATPETPGLLPQREHEEEEEDDDDDDEWERISAYCDEVAPSQKAGEAKTDTVEDDDHDVIVLGELELEDPEEVAAEEKAKSRRAGKKGKVSYAAALGMA